MFQVLDDSARNTRPLDRNSVVPLYHQLFIDLRRRLVEGEWKPGDPFPKDSEIEQAYNVSRITVRQAVAQLVDTNFVVRYRGRGSFVGNLPPQGALVNHRIVADEIRALGLEPSHTNLGPIENYGISDLTAEQFQAEIGANLIILRRLHLADGEPFCLESIMVLEDRFPNLFDDVLLDKESLTQAYRRYGIDVVKCDQSVGASLLSDERRKLLQLPDGVPALVVERVGYSSNNTPLDVRKLHYRSDLFSLRQEIIWGAAENRIV